MPAQSGDAGKCSEPKHPSQRRPGAALIRATARCAPTTSNDPAHALRINCGFERAIDLHGVPDKITIDTSGANTAALVGTLAVSGADIEMRQGKYLNNIVEQDHRATKRVVRPILGFKNFRCARALIAGIETMHMLKKGQLDVPKDRASSAAKQFYSLAF